VGTDGALKSTTTVRWNHHRVFLTNTRKTERGAGQFLTRLEVRAAPFALEIISARRESRERES